MKTSATIECNEYTPYPVFVWEEKANHENNLDDLKTVEVASDTNFLYEGIKTISKKGHNSGTTGTCIYSSKGSCVACFI